MYRQARGNDKFNYHKHVERVKSRMDESNINLRKLAMEELSNIFYIGLNKKGKF